MSQSNVPQMGTEATAQYSQQRQQQPQGQQQAMQQPQQQYQQQQGGSLLPQEYRQVLNAVGQSVQVCGWCADQCIRSADQNMIECARLCEDVVELGETLLALAPRDSQFTAELAQTFERAAQMCAQECGRHSDAHCQECATVLQQTIPSVRQLSAMTGQQQHQQGLQTQQFPQ